MRSAVSVPVFGFFEFTNSRIDVGFVTARRSGFACIHASRATTRRSRSSSRFAVSSIMQEPPPQRSYQQLLQVPVPVSWLQPCQTPRDDIADRVGLPR